ncbi:DUF1574 family protein [Calothrix sp. FACHB-1219]|uniref:DUF1574 family protein n=1 Tax=unclassified Calothrix TaxID=2619626 RepID=UPI0016868644|nr:MULTISPECIES: DUF1574 family protein [unclassified Calothrix]MBD2204755.1 DUF1574 family protein [Calothrix sp. FACHB-168]MBD2218097.1 DUF1574 family protein [Calothrix sp. FACHB-1219]
MKTASLDRQQSIVQWVSQATGINTFGVKVRLQGNDLHILCEGTECPRRWRILSDLLQALQQTDLDILTNSEQTSIYQVFVYGRKKGESRAQWCHRVYLNQLEKHLEQVKQALLEDERKSQSTGGALILSNESLAKQGHPDGIARYLSETLSTLGVAVEVKVKPQQGQRLWIFCQSGYSPDATLLAEPVAKKLRHLKLSGYEDAIIVSQVNGETTPDWLLRVDLTPPEVMLKEWARWGDVQAIARLLTEMLSELKVAVQASLQESTLHIFCTPSVDPLETAPAPEKHLCLPLIISQLEAIAPQGIKAATIYGKKTTDKQPAWIDWISLPATQHPALAPSALELATAGDQPAIDFLLERLLNPDLDWRLKTGGMRVMPLVKGDLLHVMCDAPVCPARKKVATKVVQLIRQLKVPGILGVRVYGRRAGDKEPAWHHGEDFQPRQRLVPEATPEFAATAIYIKDLVHSQPTEPILRPDLTTEEVQTFIQEVTRDWWTTTTTKVKKLLLQTQLFSEIGQPTDYNSDGQGIKIALVWGTLGLLLTMQTDWVLGQIITRNLPSSPATVTTVPSPSSTAQKPSPKPTVNNSQRTAFLANTDNNKTRQSKTSVFNASSFTQNEDIETQNLEAAPLKEKATATAILLAARSQMPSYNARQLDEQIALYKERLAKTGNPPHVLIIGSSRALRGVDPAALSQTLATQGYPNIDVFNFGVNGATAQVVDFIVRRVLEPEELPKLILWADGSRAFNSGRKDITFAAIASSPGYKKALEKAIATGTTDDLLKDPAKPAPAEKTKIQKPEMTSYQLANHWLNQAVAAVSASYPNRDRIKELLQKQLNSLPLMSDRPRQGKASIQLSNDAPEEETTQQSVDFDGFLALSVRFHPARYYQKHPKVTGNYDNDYQSFQIEGEQDAAFNALLEFTQARKIPLVFVNMPLTADYLDPIRQKYEQQFQQYMLQMSNNPNFIYRDISKLWPKVNDYFSDPSHLNRFGAYEVSKKLARDPMIPWSAK